jgi:hypothetical protein
MGGSGCGLIFEVATRNLNGGTEEIWKDPIRVASYRELNPGPPKYEPGVSCTRPVLSYSVTSLLT